MAESFCFNMKDYLFDIRPEFFEDLMKNEGDFIMRKTSEGYEVDVLWRGRIRHYKPTYNRSVYSFGQGDKEFTRFDELIAYYCANAKPVGSECAVLKKIIRKLKTTYEMNDIEVISKLGQGTFGEVFKVMVKSENKLAAMKTLKADVSERAKEQFVKEFEMMQTMKHENVIGCLGVVRDERSKQMKILLELVNKGALDKLLRESKLTERGKSRILLDVCRGMAYLHRRGIIHRDLAARNILVHRNDDGSVTGKVSDFGLSQMDESGQGYDLQGAEKIALKQCAPECVTKKKWTLASDVWSYGVLMWEVFTDGMDPYSDIPEAVANRDALLNFIKDGGHPSKPKNIPDDKLMLMWSCWNVEPTKRPTMDSILTQIEKSHKTYRIDGPSKNG